MADYATKQDLKNLEDKIDKKFDDLTELIGSFANDVDNRFNKLEYRVDNLQNTVEGFDAELRSLNNKYDHLVNTIDGFIARIDHYETELAARDAEIARLRLWIEAIAKKTGVKQPF